MDDFIDEMLAALPDEAAPAGEAALSEALPDEAAPAGEALPAVSAAAAAGPAPVLNKEDCVLVAQRRRLPYTAAGLWKMTAAALEALVGAPTDEECAAVVAQRARRAPYSHLATVAAAYAEMRRRGLTPNSGMTRLGAVDALLADAAPAMPGNAAPGNNAPTAAAPLAGAAVAIGDLDADQALAVARHGEAELYIHAGPGAGKTTTVCTMIRQITAAAPEARVLALVFNCEAERELTRRLKGLGVPLIGKGAVGDLAACGCAVLTFHKFGHWGAMAPAVDLSDMYDDETPPPGPLAAAAAPPAATPQQPKTAPPPPFKASESYRRKLEGDIQAIRSGAAASAGWSHLVLDEAQDINTQYESLVDALLAATPRPNLIAAGDPRQEVYDGCRWFGARLRDAPAAARVALRYNHRSTPEIVAALNAYSRAAFPSLHVDQIACRPPGEPVRVVAAAEAGRGRDERVTAVGAEVGRLLAAAAPGQTFALAPVTLKKWRLESAMAAARQHLHEAQPGASVQVFEGDDALKKASHVFATAKKIKGLERARVAVYGVDPDYSAMVARSALARQLFVALSRARDELFVVVPANGAALARTPTIELLGPLLETAPVRVAAAAAPRRDDVLCVVPVTDQDQGLTSVEHLGPLRYGQGPAFSRLTTPYRNDADFVGCFLEALLAKALGATLIEPGNLVVEATPDRDRHGCFSVDGKWRVVTSPATAASLGAVVASAGAGAGAYYDTMIRYTFRAGRVWTVSERLLGLLEGLEAAAATLAAELRARLGAAAAETPTYNATRAHPLRRHRAPPSEAPTAHIHYAPDLEFASTLVELKHVAALDDNHRRQAAIYATLTGRRRCLLLNMADGASEYVEAFPAAGVELAGRAVVAMRIAKQRAIQLNGRAVQFRRERECAVALDVETDEGGAVTEIGAVAFQPESGTVLGTFWGLAPGVAARRVGAQSAPPHGAAPPPHGPGKANFSAEWLTDLTITDAALFAAAGPRLLDDYRAWADTISASCALLHWGGSEKAFQREDDVAADVLHRVFRPWLAAGGDARRGGTRLADAVDQLVPRRAHPLWHRAFEDALGLMMVYTIAVNHESAC